MADHLGRPELLDDVRKNLEIMTHLFHEDGTVVTSISNVPLRFSSEIERMVCSGTSNS